MSLEMDPVFTSALRGALIAKVGHRPFHWWQRLRMRFGLGIIVGSVVVAGGAAAAAAVLSLPGGNVDTPVGPVITATHTGTATINLGQPPSGATNVSITLTCLSAGVFDFPDGSSMSCAAATDQSSIGRQAMDVVTLPVGQQNFTIAASAGAVWTVRATYINRVVTAWGVNALGETYGVVDSHGTPDLVAVYQNGVSGYVKAADLTCASGGDVRSPTEALAWESISQSHNISIPIYESDGTTVVGSYLVGSAAGSGVQILPVAELTHECAGGENAG